MRTVIRGFFTGFLLSLSSTIASAACFPVGEMPKQITYADHAVHMIFESSGESTSYYALDKKGVYQNTATILSGMFLQEIKINGTSIVRYKWNGTLPTRKDMIVGAVFDVSGTEDSGITRPVKMHIEVVGTTTARVAGCRYPALKLRYSFEVVGGHGSAGTRVMDPVTMQTYRADFAATNPDGTTSKFHPVIAKLE